MGRREEGEIGGSGFDWSKFPRVDETKGSFTLI